MDERQIKAITKILMDAGIAEDVIASEIEALSAGLPLGRQAAAALEGFQLADVQSILPTDPALPDPGPEAKAPFKSAMDHAAQMAIEGADDSGSGIQKAPSIPEPGKLPSLMVEQNVIPALNPRIALSAEEQAREWNARHSVPAGAQRAIAGQSGGGTWGGSSGGGGEGGGDWSAMEITGLASGLAGTALGVAGPWLEQDTQYEKTLADRAAGDTIARREGTLAAGQMQRGIMSTSIGRRDISPGLALRNAQMAGGQAASDIMARAAIASAAERQAAENQLAKMRAERIGQSVNAGIAGLSQLGAFASSQAAAQKQDARSQAKLDAYRDRTAAMYGRG